MQVTFKNTQLHKRLVKLTGATLPWLLAMTFGAGLPATSANAEMVTVAPLHFRLPERVYFVDAVLANGVGKDVEIAFVLDTGAAFTLMPLVEIEPLKLERVGTETVYLADGAPRRLGRYAIPSFTLGDCALSNVEVLASDIIFAHAYLGADLLSQVMPISISSDQLSFRCISSQQSAAGDGRGE